MLPQLGAAPEPPGGIGGSCAKTTISRAVECQWEGRSFALRLRKPNKSVQNVKVALTRVFEEQKFELLLVVDFAYFTVGMIPGFRHDDLTCSLFRSDAGVDPIAYCDGVGASRCSAR